MATVLVENLVKKYNSLVAVDHLSLSIESGSVYGLIGPNGAGKTTTLNILAGLLEPTSGTIRILGLEYGRDSVEIKAQLGFMRDEVGLYEQLSGREYLSLVGSAYGLSRQEIASRSEELLEFMALSDSGSRLIHEYSTGMKKKLALASVFLHQPKLLILDEPFEGIDPPSLALIRDAMGKMKDQGVTILLTSHVLERVERICTDIAIIEKGQLQLTCSMEEIRRKIASGFEKSQASDLETLVLKITGDETRAKKLSWLE